MKLTRGRVLLATVLCAGVAGCGADGADAAAGASGSASDSAGGADTGGVDASDAAGGSDAGVSATPDGSGAGDDAGASRGDLKDCDTDCDDGNPCTKDGCGTDGACVHTWSGTPECQPTLTLTAPERAAMLDLAPEVSVTGSYESPGDSVTAFIFGGETIAAPASDFQLPVSTAPGVNIVSARVEDKSGQAQVQRAFLMSEGWYPVTSANEDTLVPAGLTIRLGPALFDDDDTSDADDLATLATEVLAATDLATAVPESLTAEGEGASLGWCEWTVTINSIEHTVGGVDLKPSSDGLTMAATLNNVVVDFDAVAPDLGCPDAGGTMTVDTIAVAALVVPAIAADGTVSVTVPEESLVVTLGDVEFDLTEGAASSFDFLLNWFSDTIGSAAADAAKAVVVDQVAPATADLLTNLAHWTKTFELGEIYGVPVNLSEEVRVLATGLDMADDGVTLTLGTTATTPAGDVKLAAKGSLVRAGCGAGGEAAPTFDGGAPIAMALHDDVLNQALFAAWWGGALHQTMDVSADLVADLGLPVENLSVTLSPSLPPVVTDCSGGTQLQIGDLRIDASLDFSGKPSTVSVWVSGIATVSIGAVAGSDGAVSLNLEVTSIDQVNAQVTEATGGLEGSATVADALASKLLEKVVLGSIGQGALQSFPVPQFHFAVPGGAEGAVYTFSPTDVSRTPGRTVLTGKLGN